MLQTEIPAKIDTPSRKLPSTLDVHPCLIDIGDPDRQNMSEMDREIIRQVEFYFGNYNLPKDRFMLEKMDEDNGTSFRRNAFVWFYYFENFDAR